jgi:dTDP-4-amino-4,6-dideoxygalactose transaminase
MLNGVAAPILTAWPPLPPGVYVRRPAAQLPFPLDRDDCRIVAWGRHALWHGIHALGLQPGAEVLMPAYHHGSEVQAILETGLVPRFYDSDGRLEPRQDELDALITPRTKALHLTHYLGFPQDARRWRRWCDERGVLMIEDAAQAWLARAGADPVGSFGDLSFFCLYKTFGVPEGAAVLCKFPLERRRYDPRLGTRELIRKHGTWLASRSGVFSSVVAAVRRRPRIDAATEFELRDPASMPWRPTMFLLHRIADSTAAERRRQNYRELLGRVGTLVPAPFDRLANGASPFAFPVEAPNKEAVVKALFEAGIRALDLWSYPHPALPRRGFPEAEARRASTVALPVHQELRKADLARMATELERALRSGSSPGDSTPSAAERGKR